MLDKLNGNVEVGNADAPSKSRREVLSKLALGGAYVAPMVLAGMTPTRAAAASAGGSAPTLPLLPDVD